MELLNYRKVITIDGDQNEILNFLQNIITNDIYKINDGPLYALILSPQGKILYDLFISKNNGTGLYLDSPAQYTSEIIDLLNLYKMRRKIQITLDNQLAIAITSFRELSPDVPIVQKYLDPRSPYLGTRLIIKSSEDKDNQYDVNHDNLNEYHLHRLQHSIAELCVDFNTNTYFPFYLRFDEHNKAIDYQKGCYVGQEIVTRTKHRGVVRKKCYAMKITDCSIAANATPNTSARKLHNAEGKIVGELMSYYNDLRAAMILVNLNYTDMLFDKNCELTLEDNRDTIRLNGLVE